MNEESNEISLAGIPVEPLTPAAPHPKIEFTILTAKVPVGKTIAADSDGKPKKSPGKGVPAGDFARTTAHGLAHLSRILGGTTSRQFVTWGVTANGKDGSMITKARAKTGAKGISRTKDNFVWPAGPASCSWTMTRARVMIRSLPPNGGPLWRPYAHRWLCAGC